jgi:hypothetical protein
MRIGCLAIILAGFAVPTRADFLASIGSTSIPQGQTGSVDVLLSSTANASSPDLLNNLAFTLQITGVNELQFSSVQNFSYLASSQYVFFGDSADQKTGSPGGSVTTTAYANDTFVGNDSTFSGNPVSLSSASGPVLLARLRLDASITNAGDAYTISLIPSTGNGSMSGSTSTFFDVINSSSGGETSAVPFASTSGTVTIAAAPVPEPDAIVSGLTGVMLVAGFLVIRRLRHAGRTVTD